MTVTLNEARQIVRMLPVQRAPIRLPQTGSGGENPFDNDSGGGTSGGTTTGGGGTTTGGSTAGGLGEGAGFDDNGRPLPGYDINGKKIPDSGLPVGWTVNPRTGELLPPSTDPVSRGGSGVGVGDLFQVGDTVYRWNGTSVTKATVAETNAFLNGAYDGGGGGSSDPYAASKEARAAAGFAADEEQRRISNALTWQDLLNSQKYADRNFAQGQLQDNRTEMGNRAQSGYSLGNLLMDISTRDDALANDPGNFPAWLTAMQSNQALGPTVQNLVGEGVSINPQNTGRGIDDPRFNSVLDTLFDYSKVPSAGDVDRTQQAYNTDPVAAQRWFEAADALDKRKGMATGGVMEINRPMRLQDLTTGETTRVMGEDGAETMAVAPNANGGVSYNDPRIGSAGTFGALAKALRAGNMYSAIPRDVIDGMAGGMAPQPGAIPDWVLAKLPPSLRQLLVSGVRSQLGQSGLEDWDWTRSLYEPKGFSGLAGGIAR